MFKISMWNGLIICYNNITSTIIIIKIIKKNNSYRNINIKLIYVFMFNITKNIIRNIFNDDKIKKN